MTAIHVSLIYFIGTIAGKLPDFLLPGMVSTLQHQFSLNNAQIAVLYISNDVMELMITAIVGYYGQFYHKGKILALGFLVSSFGCFIFTLPNWLNAPDDISVVHAEKNSTNLTEVIEGNVADKLQFCRNTNSSFIYRG